MTSQELAQKLRSTVADAAARLEAVDKTRTGRRPAEGKWSAREILGHLIDSTTHNHLRIVNAQLKDDLVFDGYDQEGMVDRQRYQEASWSDLLHLWRAYNDHLARVISVIPDDVMRQPRRPHSLDRILRKQLSPDQPAALQDLVSDYIAHLRHHLDQILAQVE